MPRKPLRKHVARFQQEIVPWTWDFSGVSEHLWVAPRMHLGDHEVDGPPEHHQALRDLRGSEAHLLSYGALYRRRALRSDHRGGPVHGEGRRTRASRGCRWPILYHIFFFLNVFYLLLVCKSSCFRIFSLYFHMSSRASLMLSPVFFASKAVP